MALTLGGVLVVVGCDAGPPRTPPAAGTTGAIVGGTNVAACGWPSTVLIAGECSGVLVHPHIVLTAAHCITDFTLDSVVFGETDASPARTVAITSCTASPAYNTADVGDIGFCVLAQDVTDVPIVWPMATCEAGALVASAAVVEVGFGQNVPTSGAGDGFGTKRTIAATIASNGGDGRLKVTVGSQNGEYFGDSGGPIFFHMPDSTWRVAGVDCCSPDIDTGSSAARESTYTALPTYLAWLETASGVDLTPCHGASGWSPGAACAAFATSPATGGGSWSNGCAGGPTATPQATCGGATGTGGATGMGGTGAGGSTGGTGGTTTGTGGTTAGTGGAAAGTGGGTGSTGGTIGGTGATTGATGGTTGGGGATGTGTGGRSAGSGGTGAGAGGRGTGGTTGGGGMTSGGTGARGATTGTGGGSAGASTGTAGNPGGGGTTGGAGRTGATATGGTAMSGSGGQGTGTTGTGSTTGGGGSSAGGTGSTTGGGGDSSGSTDGRGQPLGRRRWRGQQHRRQGWLG